jgi:hypothetical protein
MKLRHNNDIRRRRRRRRRRSHLTADSQSVLASSPFRDSRSDVAF